MPHDYPSTPLVHLKVQLLASCDWLPFQLQEPDLIHVGYQVVDLANDEQIALETSTVTASWFSPDEIDTLRAAYAILHRRAESALHLRPYQMPLI